MGAESFEQSNKLKNFRNGHQVIKEMTAKGLAKTVSINLDISPEKFDEIKDQLKKINRAPYPSIILD